MFPAKSLSGILFIHAFIETVFPHWVRYISPVRYSPTRVLGLRTALCCVCFMQGFGSVGVQPSGNVHVNDS